MLSWRIVVSLLLALAIVPQVASGGEVRSVEEDLRLLERGQPLSLSFPGARLRISVFTYEDPDGTGLGDALAALVGRQVLFTPAAASIGVLRYEGRLAGSNTEPLSYFEKVDKLTAAQDVTLAIWGVVRRSGAALTIDTYLQLPSRTLRDSFRWRMPLPKALGPDKLVAQMRPDRIRVQRLELPAESASQLIVAAREVDVLKAEPRDTAPVKGTITRGSLYWLGLQERDWIEVNTASGLTGWVPMTGHCTEQCAVLMRAADFAAALLEFTVTRSIPRASEQLSEDAYCIRDQIEALELLDKDAGKSLSLVSRWLETEQSSEAPAPPGGAALANLRTLATLAQELGLSKPTGPIPYASRFLPKPMARELAFKLAKASQTDPHNDDVLHNLAVLFHYGGDEKRAQLARDLARASQALTGHPAQ